MLLVCFFGFGGPATAKTPKTLNVMTVSQDLLRFKGPKASEMTSKIVPETRKDRREERKEQRRER